MSLWGHATPKPQQWHNKSQEYLKCTVCSVLPQFGSRFSFIWAVRIKHHQDRASALWNLCGGQKFKVMMVKLVPCGTLFTAYKELPLGVCLQGLSLRSLPASFGNTRLIRLNMPVWLHLAHPKSPLSKQSHEAGVGLPYMNLKRHSAISFFIILRIFITYLFTEQNQTPDAGD